MEPDLTGGQRPISSKGTPSQQEHTFAALLLWGFRESWGPRWMQDLMMIKGSSDPLVEAWWLVMCQGVRQIWIWGEMYLAIAWKGGMGSIACLCATSSFGWPLFSASWELDAFRLGTSPAMEAQGIQLPKAIISFHRRASSSAGDRAFCGWFLLPTEKQLEDQAASTWACRSKLVSCRSLNPEWNEVFEVPVTRLTTRFGVGL